MGSPIKVQVQTDENKLKAVRHKSNQGSIKNCKYFCHIKPEHELIFYDSIDKN